jgi:hypothetical protein
MEAVQSGGGIAALGGVGTAPLVTSGQSKRKSDQEMFKDILAQAKVGGEGTPEERARKAAEQLVSTALVQPIFKRLRESNMAAAPFGPNQMERTFGPMRDAAFAQRMVGSQNWALVDRLAQRMLGKTPEGSGKAEADAVSLMNGA